MGELPVHNQFSGQVDIAIQAGQIHGGVHLHGRRARLHLPGRRSRRGAELAAADALADAVFDQWRRTVRDRGLFPDPIPVRWSWRRRPLSDPVANGPVTGPFDPLPGLAVTDAGTAPAGTIDDLLGVYAGLRSGRAVLLGDAGSGKSDAAAWIVFQALRIRDRLDREERARFPVPILLTITGWDHHRESLDDWLASELEVQYAVLRRGRFGRTMARRLLDSDRIALFLDSLDEMAPDARTAALEQIDRRALYRVVIFSRTEEFDAIRAGRLRGAAELTLSPVSPGDAATYFRRCHGERAPEAWERLITRLDRQPASLLARALDSPLMLTLVRDAFPDPSGVRALLQRQHATRQEIHRYLLDRLVDVAYQPSPGPAPVTYEPTNARRWLSYLAVEMTARGTYSLDWRHLLRWKSAWPRIAITTAVIMLVGALGGAIFFGPGGYAFYGTHTNNFGLIPQAAGGLVIGLWLGLLLGLAVSVAAELRRHTPNRPGRRYWRFAGRSAPRLRLNLGAGATVGIIVGIVNFGYGFKIIENQLLVVLVTVLVSISTGAGASWVTARAHPAPGRTRLARWKLRYSRFPLLPGLAGGLAGSFQYWYPDGIPGEVHLGEGLLNGVSATLFVSLFIGAMRPHSHARTVTGRDSDWKREIRRAVAYGAFFGITLGLSFGLREIFMWIPPGEGPQWDRAIPALWQTIGVAIPFGVGFGLTICEPWRASMLFLQLRGRRVFPVRGMRFLEDAYQRRLLRTEGPRFQFRHALLHDTLATEAQHTQRREPARELLAQAGMVDPDRPRHVPQPVRRSGLRLGATAFTTVAVAVLGCGLWLATENMVSTSLTSQLWAVRVSDNAPAGQCIATEDRWNGNKHTMLTIECNQPHWGEVLGYPALGVVASPYPGDDQVLALASFECGRLRAQYGLPADQYEMALVVPFAHQWSLGMRYTICVVHRADDKPMTTK